MAEQTCRLTAKMPQSDNFLDDESDEEGFMKPKPPPIYLRPPVIDKKMMALMSSKVSYIIFMQYFKFLFRNIPVKDRFKNGHTSLEWQKNRKLPRT